jgi:hypothetical protein
MGAIQRAMWTLAAAALAGATAAFAAPVQPIRVSNNGHMFAHADGTPFFWMGDTAWLLLERLTRAEAERYLDTRRCQGFTIVQIMVLHGADQTSRAAGSALIDGDIAAPRIVPGYDYWDHLDWVIRTAADRGLYVALVPAWGSLADNGALTPANASGYARFLGARYGRYPNVVWLVGGDTRGDSHRETWETLGSALDAATHGQLIGFHPRGRTDSSWWFHDADWLDFDMFQSGHKSYAQEAATPDAPSEDNWRFVVQDRARTPPKPTLDGEPSYENIPHGLHDLTQPRWQAADVRRYAYWSVFAGAAGHTYGDNDVMQFYVPGGPAPAFGADTHWADALHAPGAEQMRFLAALIHAHADRAGDPGMIVSNGTRYDRVIAARERRAAMAYSYTGAPFTVRLGRIAGREVHARWFSPRTGETHPIGVFANRGVHRFDPPGATQPGNDWVLLLDDTTARPPTIDPEPPPGCDRIAQ